jgi:hypothetical protein
LVCCLSTRVSSCPSSYHAMLLSLLHTWENIFSYIWCYVLNENNKLVNNYILDTVHCLQITRMSFADI